MRSIGVEETFDDFLFKSFTKENFKWRLMALHFQLHINVWGLEINLYDLFSKSSLTSCSSIRCQKQAKEIARGKPKNSNISKSFFTINFSRSSWLELSEIFLINFFGYIWRHRREIQQKLKKYLLHGNFRIFFCLLDLRSKR